MMPPSGSRRGPRIAVLTDPERPGDLEAVARLQAVAAGFGATVVAVRDTAASIPVACDFALVLSVHGPKPFDIPTYALVTGGAGAFAQAARFRDLLTYDGYLTLSDGVMSWLRNVLFGTRKLAALVGRFSVTAPRSACTETPGQGSGVAFVGRPGVCPERDAVLTTLAERPYLRLYGPGWEGEASLRAVGGPLPPDGQAILDAYRSAGAGLCLDPAALRADCGLTARLFDIVAAGVPCICAWTPSVEALFGDSLLYVDLDAPVEAIVWQIDSHMAWLAANQAAAVGMAQQANRIFQDRFTLDVLFAELLAFHGRMDELRGEWQAAARGVPITIAVLGEADEKAADRFAATFAAIAGQRGVRPDILAVTWGDGAVPYAAPASAAGLSVVWERVPDGRRGDALWTALDRLRGCPGFFCILDAGDRPCPDHLSSLLATLRKVDGRYWHGPVRLAYGGARREAPASGQNPDQDAVHFQFFSPGHLENPLGCAPAPGFLARTELIDEEVLQNPALADGEDLYLWLLLAERTVFAFSALVTLAVAFRDEASRPVSEDFAERILMRFFGHIVPGTSTYSLMASQSDGTTFEAYIDPVFKIPAFHLRRSAGAVTSTNLLGGGTTPPSWPASVRRPEGLPLGVFRLSVYFARHWANDSLSIRLEPLDGGAVRTIAVSVQRRPFGRGIRLDGEFEVRETVGPTRLTILSEMAGAPEAVLAVGLWKLRRPLIYRLGDLACYDAVWIYGGGGGGRIILRRMAEAGLPPPAGILDSFLTGELEGIPIRRLDEVLPLLTDRVAVLIASQYWIGIHASLKAADVRNVFSAFPFTRDLIHRLDEET